MKLTLIGKSCILISILVISGSFTWKKQNYNQNSDQTEHANKEAVEAWRSYRVGLFIHWGPSAGLGTPQSHSHARKSDLNPSGSVPAEEYDELYKKFNPINYNPDSWLKLAHNAGMRYTVFVAKHHDGFCMFGTEQTTYNILATPYGKDVASMFADATRRQGLALGWQIAPKDWKHPDYNQATHDRYNLYYENLITELSSKYGPVSVFWFDGIEPAGPDKWKDTPDKVAGIIRKNAPQAMLSTHGGGPFDFISFEQLVGPFDRSQPWEMCEQINPGGWIFNKPMPSYPLRKLLRNLIYTISRDGNYLLDIGPMPDGSLYPPDSLRLTEFAEFMKVNAEGVHGTRGGPYRDGDWGGATCKGKNVYLFISDRVGEEITLPLLDAKVISAKRLDGKPVKLKFEKNGIDLRFSDRASGQKPLFICVKLELDREAFTLPVVDGQQNLAASSGIVTSSTRDDNNTLNGPQNLFDTNANTFWDPDPKETLSFIEFDFGKTTDIGSISFAQTGQRKGWNNFYKYKVLIRGDEKSEWKTLSSQFTCLGGLPVVEFEPEKAKFLRLEIETNPGKAPIQLSELRILLPAGTAPGPNQNHKIINYEYIENSGCYSVCCNHVHWLLKTKNTCSDHRCEQRGRSNLTKSLGDLL
jgi:alpha-L-fucosidase